MNELIEPNIPYSHAIAAGLLSHFPSFVDRKDVESAAEFGLVQAAKSYDPSRNIAFTTFAYYRIRGAVFDLLRQTAKTNRFLEGANDYMADQTDAHASDAPSYEAVKNLATGVVASYFLSLENLKEEPRELNAEAADEALIQREQRQLIQDELNRLPEKNRRVLQMYYFEDLTLEDIGTQLNLSKSWVSRVHAKALEQLKPAMERILSQKAGRVKEARSRGSG